MNLPVFALERFFDRFEFFVPYLLAASDCETWSIRDLFEDAPQDMEDLLTFKLGYTETKGNPELRRMIATLYQKQSIDSILVCNGAEEAIYLFMNAMLSPGDHVVVHYPCYQSLHEIPRSIGCDVSLWEARPENGWEPDILELEKLLTPRTRSIIVNSPHNPTGFLATHAWFQRIAVLAEERKIMLFSDEAYRFLEYRIEDRIPAAADISPMGISLGVLSKSFGLAGLRLGWIATTDKEVIQRISVQKDYTTICPAAPSEIIAIQALKRKETILQRNLTIVNENLQHLRSFMNSYSYLLDWIEPKAGCVAFPKFLHKRMSMAFYEHLAKEYGILLLPGSVFWPDEFFFRLGFGRRNFLQGLEKLSNYFSQGFKEI